MLLSSACTIFAKNTVEGYIMDGLIDFLVFVGFIGFCIFFNKINEVAKKSQQPSVPKPVVIGSPSPQKSAQPAQQKNTVKQVRRAHEGFSTHRQSADISRRMDFHNEGIRSTQTIMPPIEPQQYSEYEMKTAEDIRKAIVWSEVLKRKY